MKVENMTSSKGNKVANQFITRGEEGTYFQSYDSVIAFVPKEFGRDPKSRRRLWGNIQLDVTYWDYSKTTGKYRNIFLGETKKETEAKIKSGEYILTDLN